jgi:hypothetical protein
VDYTALAHLLLKCWYEVASGDGLNTRVESSLHEYLTTSLHRLRVLRIAGPPNSGKTIIGEAAAAELALKYQGGLRSLPMLQIGHHFARSLEILKKFGDIENEFSVILLDDVFPFACCRKEASLDEILLNLIEVSKPVQLPCRNNDLALPANTFRIFTTNIMRLDAWLCGEARVNADVLNGVKRRIFNVEVTSKLYTDDATEAHVCTMQSSVDDANASLLLMKQSFK